MIQRKMFALRNKNIREFHDLRERMNSVIIEFICCLPIIKAFSLTTASYQKYVGTINSFTDFMCQWGIKASGYYALFKMFLSSGIIFIVPAGVYLILQGESNAVELSLFLLMGLALTAPLDRLLLFAGSLSLIIESVSRIDDILHAKPLPVLSPEQTPEAFDVVFENVSFSYGERTVLSDVSLTLKSGTKTAFVGYSGAGKTTATQLLARYHDPDKGRILIGGVDIRFINSHELASCMSLVMQNTFLFNDTVENNIRAGNTTCSFQDVTHAAEAACAL